MSLETTRACVSDLVLDEWLGQALDAPDCARVEAHLRDCVRCRLRKELFESDHAAFLAQAPSLNAHAKLAGRTRGRLPARFWMLTAAAALALAWVVPGLQLGAAPDAANVRTKGGASVSFFVKRGESVTRGTSGMTVHPGDWLRFTYSSDRSLYFALLNRDPRGARVYFPWGPTAAPLPAGRDRALDFSVELDESLGPEQVYAMFCSSSFEVGLLRAALENSAALTAPKGCQLEVVQLQKEPSR